MTENTVSSTSANRKFWKEFLELYKSLPVLWRVDSKEYCDRVLKAKAYDKLIEKMKKIEPNADRLMVVRKINSFRSNYRRDFKKFEESQRSAGAGETLFKSSLWYFELLGFLKNCEENPERTEKPTTPAVASKRKKRKRKSNVLEKSEECCAPKQPCMGAIAPQATAVQAEAWALQYSELSGRQRVLARKLISDILFHGCLEHLNERHVREIETVLDGGGSSSSTGMCSELCTVSHLMENDLEDVLKQEAMDEEADED